MKRLSATLWSAATAAALFLASMATPPAAQAQFDDVGVITFPTSATGAAQEHFLRGVAILHSFGWKQAREQFHAAQAIDPDFAMAYWGESLSYNHPLVTNMNPDQPREALERLGDTPEERLAKAPTEREKGLLRAVETLWGEGEHRDRAVGYMEAMQGLHETYPDDPEIAAFYALSLLTATRATRDLSDRWNVRAGTIALKLLNANPVHPGAAHYTIHSFDHPIMAPLALDAAYAFAEIAPAVSHARHMPTHIFIQHGMWDLVSGHNQSAYDVAVELWEPGDAIGDAVHALDWGQYGDLQRGDYAKARLWMERLAAMVEHEGFEAGGARGAAGTARARGAVPLLKSRYIVETEEWEIQPISDDSRTNELLATGLSAARTGDSEALAAAEKALAGKSDGEGYDHVMHMQVSALLHAGMGHGDMAADFMDKAVETVEAMAPPRGSANPVKPVHELYGEILLDLGKAEDAVAMFETSLLRMANRPRSLLGLARAHAASGNQKLAAEAYGKVAALWEGREGIAGLDEARGFVEGTTRLRWRGAAGGTERWCDEAASRDGGPDDEGHIHFVRDPGVDVAVLYPESAPCRLECEAYRSQVVTVFGIPVVEGGRVVRSDPLYPEPAFVVHEHARQNGLDVRHEGRDLFGLPADTGPTLENAFDVFRTVFVRHRLYGQPGLDDDQRVPLLAGPRNAV